MVSRPPVIALLTDFGTRDSYVGVMKGVILGIAPQAAVVDISHEVSPQDLREAAYTLLASYRYFPAGTVFCCVVDPGVGSSRRAVAVEVVSETAGPHTFVCPDNGLITPVLQQAPAKATVLLDDPRYHLENASATFHGRDIFAPVAAHLAAGTSLEAVGTRLEPGELVRLDWPAAERTDDGWKARVIYVDHFGNLITNLPGEWLEPRLEDWRMQLGPVEIMGVHRTFAEVAVGAPVAYVGSSGRLELALRQGSARQAWGVGVDAPVTVTRRR